MPHIKNQGFALVELMVVVAILSMAAAFFVPRFLKHRIQKKQEVCRKNLESLHASEKNYFEKNGTFTTDLNALGWSPQASETYHYRFLPLPPARTLKDGFLFECFGNIDKDPTVDQARINETGHVVILKDDSSK